MTGVVLCAVDVSQPEHEAMVLQRAAQLSALDDARLDVMTVVPDYGSSLVGSFFEEGFHERVEKHAYEKLVEMVETVLGPDPDRYVRHLVATGTVYEQVLRAAEADRATIIVIGSHRPAFRDYLLGPNAARVVRHSNCSVFVVR